MRFWDTSAIVPLLIAEAQTFTNHIGRGFRDAGMVGTGVECVSAVARMERAAAVNAQSALLAFERLRQLAGNWQEIAPSEAVREAAIRILRVHPLRAADALQLAAAFIAAERRPGALEMVTLDQRLGEAARKEGFAVIAA